MPDFNFDPSLDPNQPYPYSSDDPSQDDSTYAPPAPYSNGGSSNGTTIQKIMAALQGQKGSNAGDLSSILGAFSSGQKANRVLQGNQTQGYDKLMLDAQAGRNSNESDALKKLAQTSYISGGGSGYKEPTSINLGGQNVSLPHLGFGPQAPSDAEKAGAASLQPQLQSRLMPGGSYTPTPLDTYAKPGLAENIGSYGAAGVGGLGALQNLFGGSGGDDSSSGGGLSGLLKQGGGLAGSAGTIAKLLGGGGASVAGAGAAGASGAGAGLSGALGTVGKFAGPVAGAALGAYGLTKNGSVGSDIASGAGAGAGIGSLGGPLGMGVGAGIGALVGALRGAFSVTGKEQGGRDAQATATANLGALSTPQQQAEAAKSGWPDPKQALSLIVMRDKLIQSGLPGSQAESQAESIMKNMWSSEKSGSDAVGQAASPIQAMMAGGNPMTTSQGNQPPIPGSFVTDAFSKGAHA